MAKGTRDFGTWFWGPESGLGPVNHLGSVLPGTRVTWDPAGGKDEATRKNRN
jgi:hypothetical protein